MKVRIGTFNCENLFMRYKFFYEVKGRTNPYTGRFVRLDDIPTKELEPYLKKKILEKMLHDNIGFLQDRQLERKDGKSWTFENVKTLAKKGESVFKDIKIKTIDEIYDELIKKELVTDKTKVMKNLILYRATAIKTKDGLDEVAREGGFLNSSTAKLAYKGFSEDQRYNTAKVFLANDPDIIALQEIENMTALKEFNEKYLDDNDLKKKLGTEYAELNPKYRGKYPFMVLIDSNDPRMIDVALLSRYPIVSVRTHQFEKFRTPNNRWEWLFSRDCLEIEIALSDKNGKSLLAYENGKIIEYPNYDRILMPFSIGTTMTIFVNHFKSRLGQNKTNPQSSDAWQKRQKQAQRVIEITKERFGDPMQGNFVIAGDLNDGPQSGALEPLLNGTNLWNIVEKAGSGKAWTHYYDKEDSVEQFDYLLISPSLKTKNNSAVPIIERRGLAKYPNSSIPEVKNEDRFKTVEKEDTEASDHCAVFVDLEID